MSLIANSSTLIYHAVCGDELINSFATSTRRYCVRLPRLVRFSGGEKVYPVVQVRLRRVNIASAIAILAVYASMTLCGVQRLA